MIRLYSTDGGQQIDGPRWNAGNAAVMFRLLEWPLDSNGRAKEVGECELAAAFRRVIRARALFATKIDHALNDRAHGEDGYFVHGLDPDSAWMQLLYLESFLIACLDNKMDRIEWCNE